MFIIWEVPIHGWRPVLGRDKPSVAAPETQLPMRKWTSVVQVNNIKLKLPFLDFYDKALST